jgi:hypothetical protein
MTQPDRLLLAGATGALGTEVLRQLAGSGRFGQVQILAREPMRAGMARLALVHRQGDSPAEWPLTQAEVAAVMFEPPRMFYQREQALWVPSPAQLPALAAWLQRSGVHTLVVVMPHTQGALPQALKAGLATLTEQSVSALPFPRVIWVRSAQKAQPQKDGARGFFHALGRLVLSAFGYMLPESERPLRPSQLAQAVNLALQHAPEGIHVLSHEVVQGSLKQGLAQSAPNWFGAEPAAERTCFGKA